MSGLLGALFGNSTIASALPGILSELLGAGQGAAGGGLPALIQQLEASGLGPQIQSWIGQGPNQPVSPQQLANALPPEQVQNWAQQAGTSPGSLLEALAHTLPHAVDHITPNGEVPPADAPTPDLGSLIGGLLRR